MHVENMSSLKILIVCFRSYDTLFLGINICTVKYVYCTVISLCIKVMFSNSKYSWHSKLI